MPISGDGNNVHPGAKVQGYGAVLLISEISETNDGPSSTAAVENGDERRRYSVLAASANAAEVLGVEAEGLIDADIFDAAVSPFEANTRESLREACGASDLGRRTPLVANLRHKRCKAVVVMNRTEEGVVIEVEPVVGDLSTSLQGSLETHTLVQSAVQRLQQLAGSSVSRLCQATADEVQKFLGYERVMVYKFHPDGHGEVVAEVTAASRAPTGSFLGLHFPASDIPPASREILLGVQSRMVADVKQAPVQFVTSPRLPSQSVMLASNELCGVSGSHALNMGVLGALVMPIKLTHNSTDTKSRRSCYSFEEAAAHRRDMTLRCRSGAPPPRSPLWGLLVCHHYSDAYHVDYDHRAATEFMTEVFSLHLSRSLESEDQAARQELLRVQTTVCNVLKRVSENPDSSQNNNSSLSDSLANALFRDRDAARMLLQLGGYGGGCAMFLGNEWHMAGNCPSTSQLGELLAWLTVEELPTGGRRLGAGGQWGTISLDSEGFPGAKATRHSACGILAISLVESLVNDSEQHGGCVLWTRPEMLQELSWAGNVESEVLRPREGPETEADSSFQAVKKQVELACVPWTGVEVEGTHAVKLLLQDAIKVCEEGRITSRILVAINQERLRNLDELHRVGNELQAVIRTANVPIIRLNLALKVAELNPLAVDLFAGRRPSIPMPPRKKGQPTPEPPLGLPFSAYLEYECAHQMEDILMRAVESGTEPEPFHVRLSPRYAEGGHPSAPPSLSPSEDHYWQEELLLFVQMQRDLTTGRVSELVCVCRDITAQANLIREVTSRGSDHEELMSSASTALLCVDTEGCVTGWNAAMERLSGTSRLSVVGCSLLGEVLGPAGILEWSPQGNAEAMTELSVQLLAVLGIEKLPSPSSPTAAQLDLGIVREPVVWSSSLSSGVRTAVGDGSFHSSSFECQSAAVNVRFVRAPGRRSTKEGQKLTQVDVAITCRRLLSGDGAVTGAFFFVQDLTLPKALEKAMAVQMAAQAAADAKNRHIAFLCHEIRNPVNGILASVQAIEDLVHLPSLDSECGSDTDGDGMADGCYTQIQDLVRTTLACTAQLQRTVDGILDLRQMEEGKLEVKAASFRVSNVLQTVLNQVTSAAAENGLTVAAEVQNAKLRHVRFLGDDIRIQQILANLCWNSVKFTQPGGSIRLSVGAELCDESDSMRLVWKVIDTGEGMSEEAREGLFERFAMGTHTVGKYGGSGLGLSISRTLAEMMGGRLSCTSAPGRGSTFRLELKCPIDPRGRRSSSGDTISSAAAAVAGVGVLPAVAAPSSSPHDRPVEITPSLSTSISFKRPPVEYERDEGLPSSFTVEDVGNPTALSVSVVGNNGGGYSQFPKDWGLRVLREIVTENSVGVLIEVTPPPSTAGITVGTRQLWGGANIGPGGFGVALAEATDDAVRRLIGSYATGGVGGQQF